MHFDKEHLDKGHEKDGYAWARPALEQARDGILVLDLEGRVRYLNPLGGQLLGWRVGSALGRLVEDVLPSLGEGGETVRHPLRCLLQGEWNGEAAGEILIAEADDEETWLSGTASVIHGQAGELEGVLYIFRSGAERRRLRSLLHETNNALGVARGNCDLAVLQGDRGEDLEKRMDAATRSLEKAQALLRVVRDLGETRSLVVGEPGEAAIAALRKPTSGSGTCLLLIEDNEEMRNATADLLTVLGHRVKGVPDGKAARQLLAQDAGAFTAVICDLRLPDGQGDILLASLRKLRPGLPCLFVSGDPAPEGLLSGPRGEHCAFLRKPYSAAGLSRALAELV